MSWRSVSQMMGGFAAAGFSHGEAREATMTVLRQRKYVAEAALANLDSNPDAFRSLWNMLEMEQKLND